jgi:hypothetical protein
VACEGLARGGVNANDTYISRARARLESSDVRATVRWCVCEQIYFHLAVIGTRVGPGVYIRRYVRPRGQKLPTFRANNDLQHGSIFRLYCPLHLIWRPRSPLMGPRISRSSSGEGCADRSVPIFLRFFVKRKSQENSNSNQGIIPYFGFPRVLREMSRRMLQGSSQSEKRSINR